MIRNRYVRVRRAGAALGVAALAALGATACSGANANALSGTGVLTIQGDSGNPALNEIFNPFNPAQLEGTRLIYEPLEAPNYVNGDLTPFLATGHKFTNSRTLVFTLRSGVTWSDGAPFTAQDVLFTFSLLKKYPALDTTGAWSQLGSVTASGSTVTMHFKQPSVPFVTVEAAIPIVPEHIWTKIAKPATDIVAHPVGTGPFVLKKFAPTEYIETKNPHYWNAAAIQPKQVNFPAQSTNQSTNQLDIVTGAYDWSYNYLPDIQNTYLSRDSHNTHYFPPGGTIGLYLNLTKTAYRNVDFRQGISHALDRQTIARKAVNGYTTAASMSGLVLPNLQRYLDPSLPDRGFVQQNRATAMSYFSKAGYTTRGGRLERNGKQVSITIELPNNFSDWLAAAKEIKTELAQVGIDVNLDEPQYAQYEHDIQAGSFDAVIGGFGGTGVVYNDFNNGLNSAFATPLGKATVNNFERFKSTTVDDSLKTLSGAVGLQAQKNAAYKLEQVMYQQAPVVLLYYGGSWGLFSTRNFTGWPSKADPYGLPTPYNYEMLVIVSHLKKV